MPLPQPPLLVISDRSQARRPLLAIAEAAFAGGCRWFSLREKDLPAAERRALLADLAELGQHYAAIVQAHEDIEAVIATGAGGVHLPAGGDPAMARRRLPHGLIGVSAHSAGEAAAARGAGADYATLSPIFLTDSKPGYGPALGLPSLAAATAAAPAFIVALGGIDCANAGECVAAGAAGVAVMGEVMRSPDPRAAVEALVQVLRRPARKPI